VIFCITFLFSTRLAGGFLFRFAQLPKGINKKNDPYQKGRFFHAVFGYLANEHHQHGQRHEHDRADLGDQRQLSFHALGLVLAEEGLGSAANGTQTGALAALQQNGDDHDQSGNDQQNANNHTHLGSLLGEYRHIILALITEKSKGFAHYFAVAVKKQTVIVKLLSYYCKKQ